MAITGRTVSRFVGATLLGVGAARIDHPRTFDDRTPHAPVVIASRDIREGQRIDRTQVAVAQWPVGTIPAGAFTSIDSVAGRVTRVSVFKGEALVPGRLAFGGAQADVTLTPRKRQFTVRVNDVAGIAGMILPNSRVDVVVVTDPLWEQRGERLRISRVALKNVRVLGISRARVGNASTASIASFVALEVTPEEAERLTLATTEGRIQLMLRGYGDPDSLKTSGASTAHTSSLTLVVQSPPQPKAMKPDTFSVTIIRGRYVETAARGLGRGARP